LITTAKDQQYAKDLIIITQADLNKHHGCGALKESEVEEK